MTGPRWPSLAIGELAQHTATKPTTLTGLLDRLVGRGYVVRELDPGDRRSFRVSLTEAGRPVAQAPEPRWETSSARLSPRSPARRWPDSALSFIP